MYISRYELAIFLGGSKVKIRLNLRGGISPERRGMYISRYKLVLLVDLVRK